MTRRMLNQNLRASSFVFMLFWSEKHLWQGLTSFLLRAAEGVGVEDELTRVREEVEKRRRKAELDGNARVAKLH